MSVVVDLGLLPPEPEPNWFLDFMAAVGLSIAAGFAALCFVTGIGFLCLVVGM